MATVGESDAIVRQSYSEEILEVLEGIGTEAFVLLARMAPYLLLGIVVAGIMHVLLPVGFVARQLGGSGLGSVLKAAILGVPLPLCSCGVVPVAASLKKSGAGPGAVVSFLVTTPTSGVDSILATYSLLGGAIAVVRVIASFIIGLIAGIATILGLRGEATPNEITPNTCSTDSDNPPDGSKFKRGATYAFGELLGGISRPLLIGSLLGGLVAYYLPPGVLGQYIGQGIVSYLVMLAVGMPLYVCASGSIPLAAALLAKGISPGAALIFLLAGPATNAATVTVVSQMLGKKTLVIYLTVLVLGSLGAGAATDLLFDAFPTWLPMAHSQMTHGHGGLLVFEIVCGIGLGLAMTYHLVKPVVARLTLKKKGEDMFQVEVPDMSCGHCSASITSALKKLEGIKSVHVDLATKMVDIDMGEDVVEADIARAIEDAGFHPKISV
jgi:uncharacterized protein